MDWHDGGAVAGLLAAVAGVLGFGLSRTDHAQEKREEEIRRIADQSVRDANEKINASVRLNTIETMLPVISEDVKDVKSAVAATNEKLDQLLLAGRLHIKRSGDER